MLIFVDEEGMKVVEALCDIALKTSGMKARTQINAVLANTRILPAQPPSAVKEAPEETDEPTQDESAEVSK